MVVATHPRRSPHSLVTPTPISCPPSPNSDICPATLSLCSAIPLSPLECALADKHRVLPVFSRNRPPSSPLDATLAQALVSADSKEFMANAKSFRCNTYKKPRRYPLPAKSLSHLHTISQQPNLLDANGRVEKPTAHSAGQHCSNFLHDQELSRSRHRNRPGSRQNPGRRIVAPAGHRLQSRRSGSRHAGGQAVRTLHRRASYQVLSRPCHCIRRGTRERERFTF